MSLRTLVSLVMLLSCCQTYAETRVVMLGTGTPNADPAHSGPAVAVVVNDTAYLVDFGPGVVRRAAAAHAKGVSALAVDKLAIAFVTHLHSDHTMGFADLLLTPWILEREIPLQVYGPPGLSAMAQHIVAAYQEDIQMRLNGLQPANPEGYKVVAHEISSGVIYQDENVSVEAIPVKHGSWNSSFAYKFVSADKIVVISGDAVPSESIVQACNGCDILVHEVYSDAGFETRTPDWQTYHASFHTSATELAAIASRAKPKLLVMYHQLYWGFDDATLVEEVTAAYDGEVVSSADLDIYE